MSAESSLPEPDTNAGIEYWSSQPASYDGVLGGFGSGTLPRIDALTSRQLVQHLYPDLCTVPSALAPLLPHARPHAHQRTRALDVGAGVGRVSADVLLPLVDDVVIVEPVEAFVRVAWERAAASAAEGAGGEGGEGAAAQGRWRGLRERTKSVTVLQGTLQALDPTHPLSTATLIGRAGYTPPSADADADSGFDLVWCQWCLGHLARAGLVAFLRRSRAALRDPARSLIMVKENCCAEPEGVARVVFDEEDSTVTRSDLAWKEAFEEAGLTLVREQLQMGFPEGLYPVRMYALR